MGLGYLLLCASLLLVLAFEGHAKKGPTNAEMDPQSQSAISKGLNMGEKISEGLAKLGNVDTSKLFRTLDKMAGFLGAAGGLMSFILIFLPKRESAEMTLMKKQFSKVNMKLDIVTGELDNIKDLISLENQRSQYISMASDILFGHQQLNSFLEDAAKVSCATQKQCVRLRMSIAEKYVKYLDVKSKLFAILQGSVKQIAVFGKPLLELIKTTRKCDVGKIDAFAGGVLKLAFKAQQVILAHEKLTGTKTSILASMKQWVNMVYALRRKANVLRNDCFKNIESFILSDIKSKKYQAKYSNNQDAADAVKRDLSSKYPWLNWIVFAYTAANTNGRVHGGEWFADEFSTSNDYGAFWNIPANNDDQKRYIIVTPQAHGVYFGQKIEFVKVLKEVVTGIRYRSSWPLTDSRILYDMLKRGLKKRGAWRLLKSFTVLKKYEDLAVTSNKNYHWYSGEVSIPLTVINHLFNLIIPGAYMLSSYPINLHIIAVFKDRESLGPIECNQTCSGHGECKMLPYSTTTYCECADYYQGEQCENKLRIGLASNLEKMLGLTFKIPKLSDVYFEIKDLGLYLGSNINKVFDAALSLKNQVEKSFKQMNERLTHEFRWANLIATYGDTISDLTYTLNSNISNIAGYVHHGCDSIDILARDLNRWLQDLNYLIVGRSDFLIGHKSIVLTMIDKHKANACTPKYKSAIDTAWKQLILLQFQAFMLLAQTQESRGQSSTKVLESYRNIIIEQRQILSSQTCERDIPHSINVHCMNGFYLYPGLSVVNKCLPNYYVTGSLTASCTTSGCNPCNCHNAGSAGDECSDLTGECTCKDHYYGTKCENRDCRYGSWQGWVTCPCGMGKTTTRRRHIILSREGSGTCSGTTTETKSCPTTCCSGLFSCGGKCVAKCDYINDCEDNSDEKNCNDQCQPKHTNYAAHGGLPAKLIYLTKHNMHCKRPYDVIQTFKLERKGSDDIRYRFTCCTLLTPAVCDSRVNESPYTDSAWNDGGKFFYLDRQTVDCGINGLLNGFQLHKSNDDRQVRYKFRCCELRAPYRSECTVIRSSYTDDGEGDVIFLDRQSVSCPDKHYLRSFRLERDYGHNNVRYLYTCCKIALKMLCLPRTTNFAKHGGDINWSISAKLRYLVNHNVHCEQTHLLRGFQLETNGLNIHYKYTCCKPMPTHCGNPFIKETQYTDNAGHDDGKMFYLDRQTVDCGGDSLINGFHLQENNNNQVRYKISCCKPKSTYPLKCTTTRSQFTADGGGDLRYLDRQNIYCPAEQSLRSFKLQRNNDHTKVRYEFTCCKINLS